MNKVERSAVQVRFVIVFDWKTMAATDCLVLTLLLFK